MIKKKGRMIYLPAVIIDEIEDIHRENNTPTRSKACVEMVKYARVGRELERIKNLNFKKSKIRTPVDEISLNKFAPLDWLIESSKPETKKGHKKKRGLFNVC